MSSILALSSVSLADVSEVGGKNASLGEMLRALTPLGVRVPDGFAITASAYRRHLTASRLDGVIADLLAGLRKDDDSVSLAPDAVIPTRRRIAALEGR